MKTVKAIPLMSSLLLFCKSAGSEQEHCAEIS